MKKILALLALVLGVVSCQTEPEGLDVNVGGEVETTVCVSLPEATRANSAVGAFENVDWNTYTIRYIMQVFYNEHASQAAPQVFYTNENTASFPVRLVPGRAYRFVVWADIVEKGDKANGLGTYNADDDYHYSTADFPNITLMENTWVAMDETRDAFTAVEYVGDYSSSSQINITLTRPFAKLRVITTDMVELNNLGITPVSAKVTYSAFSHESFNALNGTYSEATIEQTHTYAIADYADQTGASKVLFTDYFFADDSDVVKFELDVYEANVDNQNETTLIKHNDFKTDIPARRNYLTTIQGNILTEGNNVEVTVNDAFEGYNTIVDSAALAQEALDNAAPNTTIYLEPGVDYGTLLIRPVAGASNTITDCDYLVYRNEMLRKVENLTIVGAPDAIVDCIKVVSGYTGEGSNGYIVDIKNLVIDSVEFSDEYVMSSNHSYSAPIFIDLSYINVDGLTVKNCKLEGDNAKMNFVYLYGSGNPSNSTFETAAKNITITGNTVDGIARLCELRQAENVTITNNTIKNTYLHGMLLSVDGGKYSGNVTITNNTADGIKERFVRMAGAGDAVVVIKDNLINNYNGTDKDYIKVTDGTNITIENNYVGPINNYDDFLKQISDDTWYDATETELTIEDVADFAAFVETANSGNDFEGKTIKLNGDVDLFFKDVTALADGDPVTFRPIGDTKYNGGKPFKGTFDGQGHTIKNLYQNGWDLGYEWGVYGSYGLFGTLEDATVKNVVIEGSESYIEGGDVSLIAGSAKGDCVFENITINSGVAATYNNGCGGIIGWSGAGSYTFKDITIGEDVVLGGLWGSFDSSIGGIVGQAEPGATYNFENVTINCRIDAYNDCTASYDYYNYRMCGMIIGRCEETTTIDGKNYPDLSKYNMTFNNVVVNYGDWMNYHYCRKSGERAVRVEAGYAYGGAEGRDHSNDNQHCMEWIPFNQLIGGDQYAVKGLPAVEGVTVNYPDSFFREQGYKAEGNTYTVYTGAGFKSVATEVLADASKNVTIELANDIDLAGIEWPAVCTKAAFVLDGKGYAIKNLTTSAVEDHGFYSTAMFTSTRKAATIKNLVVENATVTGKGGDNSHGAVLVACNYAALNIEGVTVKNSTVSNCDRSSIIATYLYFTDATVKNCVVEGCTVNSIGTAGALLGMNNSKNFEATGNTVKNTTITSSEGSNKAGILIGTWQQAGTLTESGNVVENSKAINAGTETNNNIGRTV